MRKTAIGFAALVALAGSRLFAAPCAASPTALCLNANRFQVAVHWQDTKGRTGDGQAVSLTADTGYFWFFSASNVELVVKVLDARALNGRYWVFFGALSNVQYDLTVTDSSTGALKTYHNPQGQFASVGDTSAFAGSIEAPPTQETVVADGSPGAPGSLEPVQGFIDAAVSNASTKSAADFTPCLGAVTDLFLNNCRFRIQVSWQDSKGRTGDGQAVQLTNDTGYFWFFAQTNVELVIKVLDARALNGDYWVFFGALSNVQYQITVSDTLTGDRRVYSNPLGTFASVGDTAAFRPGASVKATWDDTRSVSDRFDESGGTLTATAADGTQYVLTIPPNAIFFPLRIEMTPVTHIDGLPIDGPLVGAIQIEPDGFLLMETADLKIIPPTAATLAGLTYFRYRGPGEQYIRYPGVLGAAGIELPVNYLAGYGAANGAPSASSHLRPERQLDILFVDYIQQVADLEQQYQKHLITQPELDGQTFIVWKQAWDDIIKPMLDGLGGDCDLTRLGFICQICVEFLAFDPDDDLNRAMFEDTIWKALHDQLMKCIDKAYERCKTNNDPLEVMVIEQIARKGGDSGYITGEDLAVIFDKVRKCLHFELDFESALTFDKVAGETLATERMKVRAITPLDLESTAGGSKGTALSGSSQIEYEFVTAYGGPCSYAFDTTPGTFTVQKLDLGLFAQENINITHNTFSFVIPVPRSDISVDMFYSPGDPEEQMTQTCTSHGQSITVPWPMEGVFGPLYAGLHESEHHVDAFDALHWQPVRSGNIFAKVEYDGNIAPGGLNVSEDTFIILKHMPQ